MKNIQEDLGFLGNVLNTPEAKTDHLDKYSSSEFAHNLQGIELFKYHFASWQQQIINALKLDESIYVVASPGAGKTAPVMYSWTDKILKLNPSMINKYQGKNTQPNKNYIDLINSIKKILDSPGSIPKILYAVPTRTLCDQVYNDVCNLLYQVLFASITIIQAYPGPSNIMQYIQRYFRINLGQELATRKNLIEQSSRLQLMYQSSHNQNIEKNIIKINQQIVYIDDLIYTKIATKTKEYVQNVLVQRATEIYTPKCENALFIISVHKSAYSKVFKKFGSKIKTIIIDEAHTLQFDFKNTPLKDKKDVQEKADVLYKILKYKDPKTNLIFLSGTVNPISATNLINYLNYCFGIKIRQLNSSEGNASKISIIPNDSLNNHQTLINLLISPKENNNLIILFGKKLIENLIQKAIEQSNKLTHTSKDIDSGSISSSGFTQQLPITNFTRDHTPNRQVKFDNKKLLKLASQMPGAAEIENPLLRLAVLHGFGYVFRMDKKEMSKSELKSAMKDQQIVVGLFSSGKIKTILATDAVGIGLNIKVKNLFIPTISKFNGVDFAKLGVADASQLYNRLGRRDFEVSTIYTPEENIPDVLNAISVGNTGFENREVIKMSKSMCGLHNFYSFYNAFY